MFSVGLTFVYVSFGSRKVVRIVLMSRFLLVLVFLHSVTASAYVDEGTPPVVAFSAFRPTYFVVGKYDSCRCPQSCVISATYHTRNK